MNAYLIGSLFGALIATFLLSRLFLWLTRRWGGAARLILVHIASAGLACVLAAFGNADGGVLDWSAGAIYLPAQLVWLVVDLFAARGRTA